jgi:hypothetical protein
MFRNKSFFQNIVLGHTKEAALNPMEDFLKPSNPKHDENR